MCGIGNQDRRQNFISKHPEIGDVIGRRDNRMPIDFTPNPTDFGSGIKFPFRGRGRNDIPPQRPILKQPIQVDENMPPQGLGNIRFGGL